MSAESCEAGVSWVTVLSLWLEFDGEEPEPGKVVYRGFRWSRNIKIFQTEFLGWQELATLLGNLTVRGGSRGAVKDRQRIVRVVSGGIHIQSGFKKKGQETCLLERLGNEDEEGREEKVDYYYNTNPD